MTPGQLGRLIAKAELAIAALFGLVVALFLYVAAPGTIEPMLSGPARQETALGFIAIAGILFGSAWMIRISRTDPEPDPRAWRYRERDAKAVCP